MDLHQRTLMKVEIKIISMIMEEQKFLAENIFKKWQQENPKERCLIIIRPTVIFGKGNRGNVYNLLKTIASKKFVMFGKEKIKNQWPT